MKIEAVVDDALHLTLLSPVEMSPGQRVIVDLAPQDSEVKIRSADDVRLAKSIEDFQNGETVSAPDFHSEIKAKIAAAKSN